MPPSPTGPWQFADFSLDLDAGTLRRGDLPVALPPQQFELLSALVQSAGLLVTRETLRERLWGDDVTVDFDAGLNFCVRQLRLALGDAATQPRFIQTVPRRGYRFIAPVSPVPLVAVVSQAAPVPVLTRGLPAPGAAAAVALVACAAAIGSFVAVRASVPSATPDIRIADAHAARGFVALNDDWDWRVAERAFTRALQLDGRNEVALISLSRLHASQGHAATAVTLARQAVDAYPASARARTTLGWALLFAGQADAAATTCVEALALAPHSRAARGCRLHADAERGVGNTDVWTGLLEALQRSMPAGAWFTRATVEARAGRRDDALRSMARALAAKEPDATFALVHPALVPLRSDPAFLSATGSAGLALTPSPHAVGASIDIVPE